MDILNLGGGYIFYGNTNSDQKHFEAFLIFNILIKMLFINAYYDYILSFKYIYDTYPNLLPQ